jgi:hypothetical protein
MRTLLIVGSVWMLAACDKQADSSRGVEPAAAPGAAAAANAAHEPGAGTNDRGDDGMPVGNAMAAAVQGGPAAARTPTLRDVGASGLPAGAKLDGTIEKVVTWTDARGENHAGFATRAGRKGELTSKSLWVRHWITQGGAAQLVREIKDHVGDCEFDLTLAFVDRALGLTDLDGDGVAELTFAYQLGCRSDVSPNDLKLLILEGGDKYIIRGQTRIDMGDGERYGGERKVDASLVKGPQELRRHAEAVWDQIVEER